MAIVLIDSFDHHSTTTAVGKTPITNYGWAFTAGAELGDFSPPTGLTGPATGTQCLRVASANQASLANFRGLFSGGECLFRAYIPSAANRVGDGRIGLMKVGRGGAFQILLNKNASEQLELWRGDSATLIATSSNAWTSGQLDRWIHFRIRWTIADASGRCEVFVDGDKTGWIDFTGDTDNISSGDWEYIQFFGGGGDSSYYDDFILVDNDTSDPTNDVTAITTMPRVYALWAETGNGTHADWTPSTGTDHGAMVDETTPDGDTTYNSTSTGSAVDTYTFPPLGAVAGTITAAQINLYTEKVGAGAVTVSPVIRTGGTDYTQTAQSLTTSYRNMVKVLPENPATSAAWTQSQIEALEAGIAYTSGSDPARLTQVVLEVATIAVLIIANDDAYTVAFNATLSVPAAIGVLANDSPKVGVTAVLDADVSNGFLSLDPDGAFTYIPDLGFSGTDTFTYHTSDGTNSSNIATVTITVTGLTVPKAGTNPPYAEIPTDVPLLFMELKVGSAVTAYAETPLNDNATWTKTTGTSKRKGPKILRVSRIKRELTQQGGFGTSQVTVEVSDEDREFRTLCATSTITNSYCALYLVDDAVRRAEGEPFRVFAGVVAEHRALSGFRYELTLEDALGAYFGNAFEQPQIPPHVLTVGEFSGMDPAAEGKAGPLAFGTLTDAAAASPQGVVPVIYMGNGQLNSISGHSLAVNTTVAAFAIVEHACRSIDNIFYNHPDSPTLRHAVDNSAFGTLVWAPHKPNWSAGVGWTHNYIDFGSPVRRYTPIFALLSHSLTLAAIDGRTIISANLAGQDSTGDATGTFYTQPERMLAQLLLNYVFTSYQSGSFTDVPFFTANSYTVYDTDTLDAAESIAATRLAGGYVGAWLGGADGSQFNGYDAMRDFALGGDFDLGANRHGQIIWAREDVSATPVCSFTAQSDILDGSFEMWTDRTDYANKLAYRYEERYLPPSAPLPTPSVGAPLPRDPFKDYSPWASSITTLINTTAIANYNSRTVLYELDNRVVRQNSTAISVASYTFNRRIGPMQDGGWRFRFQTGLQGYGKGTARVELGSPILFDIPERLGTVASSPVVGYVTSHELDPQAKTVTLEGRVLR